MVEQPLGFEGLSAEAGRILAGLHLVFLPKMPELLKIYDANIMSMF
jgi:hypothetical protein